MLFLRTCVTIHTIQLSVQIIVNPKCLTSTPKRTTYLIFVLILLQGIVSSYSRDNTQAVTTSVEQQSSDQLFFENKSWHATYFQICQTSQPTISVLYEAWIEQSFFLCSKEVLPFKNWHYNYNSYTSLPVFCFMIPPRTQNQLKRKNCELGSLTTISCSMTHLL